MPYATNDGLHIHYEFTGSGKPLALYHGLTGSGERWRDTGYIAGLADAYRLILIDARGHSGSDKPHDIEGFVAGFEHRHNALPDDARAHWLANDGVALAAGVASMIAESDGSQVADLSAIKAPVLFLIGTEEPFAEQAREAEELLPYGAYVPLDGVDHVQMFFRSDLVLPLVRKFLHEPTCDG